MLAGAWNIRPGDWVECVDGRRGAVTSVCTWKEEAVCAVEVGFEWYGIGDILSWTPEQ